MAWVAVDDVLVDGSQLFNLLVGGKICCVVLGWAVLRSNLSCNGCEVLKGGEKIVV